MTAISPPPQIQWPCQPNILSAFGSNVSSGLGSHFHSQQCEDRFFEQFFLTNRDHRVLGSGVYLELGALNGKTFSNTLRLHKKYGWRGLLVEANPKQCSQLAENRPADVVACGAVCSESFGGKLSFVPLGATGHAVAMGTSSDWSSRMQQNYQAKNGNTQDAANESAAVTVACAPLGALAEQAGVARVDLLSLDVEQQEYFVLQTIDLLRFRFAVGLIELECPGAKNTLSAHDTAVRQLLETNGYEYVMRQRGNDVWIDPEVPWARKGARKAKEAARGRSMPACMLDQHCGDCRGVVGVWNRTFPPCSRVTGSFPKWRTGGLHLSKVRHV